jgi:hypothetical protein
MLVRKSTSPGLLTVSDPNGTVSVRPIKDTLQNLEKKRGQTERRKEDILEWH